MDDLSVKTIKGLHWVGSIKIITQIASWVITIFVARLLDPLDYGLMGIALIVIGFANFFGEFGLGAAIIQKKNITKEQVNTVFWIAFINGVVLFFIFYFLSPFIGKFFNSQPVVPILRVLCINFVLSSVSSIALSTLNKELRFKERSFVEFSSSTISNILTLSLAYAGFGVWSLVIGSVGRNVFVLVILSFHKSIIPSLNISLKQTYPLIKFGANIVGSRLLWYLYSKTDFFIVGKMIGDKELGVYSMAFQIASAPIDKVAEIVNPIAYASFSKLQDDVEGLKIFFLQFTKGLCLVLFPALFGMFMVSDNFIHCVLTDKWSAIIFPVKILCLVGMIRGAVSPIASLLNARGKAFLNVKYNLINITILPAAFFIGAYMNGIVGVVVAWIVVYPIISMYIISLGLKEINLSFLQYAMNLYYIVASTAIMGGVIYLAKLCLYGFYSGGWFRLLVLISIGAFSYSLSLYFFAPDIKSEIRNFFLLKKTR